jgi:hypothetical protein
LKSVLLRPDGQGDFKVDVLLCVRSFRVAPESQYAGEQQQYDGVSFFSWLFQFINVPPIMALNALVAPAL